MSKERRLVLRAAAVVGIAAVGCYSGPRVEVETSRPGCVVGTDSQPAGFPGFLFPQSHAAVVDFGGELGVRSVTARGEAAVKQAEEIEQGQSVKLIVTVSTDDRNLAKEMTPEELAEEIARELDEFLKTKTEYLVGRSILTDNDRVKRFGTVGTEIEATGENCTP